MTKISVIVADDDKDSVDIMSELLAKEGIDVVGKGYDGEEAYQLYEEFQPDIAIIDMKMPNYDGGYAVSKIKAKFPDAKIIVVTAYTDYKFDRDEVDEILYKPYEHTILINKVKELGSKKIIL